MAKAKMYALVTGKAPRKALRGQALRVFTEMQRVPEPRTAESIDESIRRSEGKPGSPDGPHVTVQDSLRVTLYYALIFKKQGLVAATEQPVTDTQETGGGRVETVDEEEPAEVAE